jgi:Methyltransferase domain
MNAPLPSLLPNAPHRLDPDTARLAPVPLAVGLFNDSADAGDVASLAASDAHRRLLARAGAQVRHASFRGDWHELGAGTLEDGIVAALASPDLRRVFAEVDVVVVIGDTGASRPMRHLLAILGAAQHLDLPTYLVTASIGADPEGRDVLDGLTDCTVRDAASARVLESLGIAHRRVDDVLFSAAFTPDAVRDFTDHLVVTDCAPARRADFTLDLAAVRAAWPGMVADYPLDAPSGPTAWRSAAADLATASAVLTGGRDGAALALAAGVPFVVLGVEAEAARFMDTLEGYPIDASDPSLSLQARLDAALAARPWFATAGRGRARRGAADAYTRLRPGLVPGGRDDAWTTSIDGALDVVRTVTAAGGSVLHAGAGQGQLVEALAKDGFRAWGADVARRLDRPDRTRYSKATATALPFADHVFSTVIVSADWLDHLEAEALDRAIGELARVAHDTVIVECSGRPLRASRAFEAHLGEDVWRRRLLRLGLEPSDAADSLVTHGAGPTGGTLIVTSAQSAVCPHCRRAHQRGPEIEPVHAGVLQAAAAAEMASPVRGSRR